MENNDDDDGVFAWAKVLQLPLPSRRGGDDERTIDGQLRRGS